MRNPDGNRTRQGFFIYFQCSSLNRRNNLITRREPFSPRLRSKSRRIRRGRAAGSSRLKVLHCTTSSYSCYGVLPALRGRHNGSRQLHFIVSDAVRTVITVTIAVPGGPRRRPSSSYRELRWMGNVHSCYALPGRHHHRGGKRCRTVITVIITAGSGLHRGCSLWDLAPAAEPMSGRLALGR